MTREVRIDKIQEAYFEFCLELLQKALQGSPEADKIIAVAYQLKEKLKQGIVDHLNNCKSEAVTELELEIKELRRQLSYR